MLMFWLCISQVPRDIILGLAKFFLGIGIPGDAKDFFHQVESLSFLESNRQVLSKHQFVILSYSFMEIFPFSSVLICLPLSFSNNI